MRPRRRGNALLEFVLTLPIVVFVAGLGFYMSLAMLAKQEALVAARHNLWRSAQHGHWSDLDMRDIWSNDAGDDSESRPRGSGEELNRLREEVEPDTVARTNNSAALDYWDRLWGNLPGRHRTRASRRFESEGSLWDFLPREAKAEYFRDSSPWHFHHIDAWKIARSGPLKPIFDSFRENLQGDVAEHFRETRDDIIERMFHATGDELDDADDLGREGEELAGGGGGIFE
jgi:hypothetical protein